MHYITKAFKNPQIHYIQIIVLVASVAICAYRQNYIIITLFALLSFIDIVFTHKIHNKMPCENNVKNKITNNLIKIIILTSQLYIVYIFVRYALKSIIYIFLSSIILTTIIICILKFKNLINNRSL